MNTLAAQFRRCAHLIKFDKLVGNHCSARIPFKQPLWSSLTSFNRLAATSRTSLSRRYSVQTSHEQIDGAPEVEKKLEPGLYIVATPIGCLEDITLRALRVLRSADKVLCEDTRRTSILLRHYDISAHLESYHLHNEHGKLQKIIRELKGGATMALVSDAGMPAINDPGSQLIAAAVDEEILIVPVPGPSATLAALVASGLSTSSFIFCGFVEAKSSARKQQFEKWKGLESTLIFFVSPHALIDSLEDACTVLGPDRRCCLARELTKTHEEFWRSSLADALVEFKDRGPRGEFTMVIQGRGEDEGAAAPVTDEEILAALRDVCSTGLAPSQAAKEVAAVLEVPKKRAYALSLQLDK